MKKFKLTENMVHYLFEPDKGKHFGYNIIALINHDKAILIDTGYERHAKEVLEDLTKKNIKLETVILTHFHDDHTNGLKVLPKVDVYGSSLYQTTLDKWTEKTEHQYLKPNRLIYEETTINFYNDRIKLIPLPGHSVCEMIVIVNDEFLFVGDEIMLSNEGKPLLPWVDIIDEHSIKRHFSSLQTLKSFKEDKIIPAHGKIINQKDFQEDLDNRITYFKTIINSDKQLTYLEATKNCECKFLHQEWFRGIYNE